MKREDQTKKRVETLVFKQITTCINNNDLTLTKILETYDFDNSGYIMKNDIIRAFKRLGVSNIECHEQMIMEKAKCEEQVKFNANKQNLVKISTFVNNLNVHLEEYS